MNVAEVVEAFDADKVRTLVKIKRTRYGQTQRHYAALDKWGRVPAQTLCYKPINYDDKVDGKGPMDCELCGRQVTA